MHRYMTWQPCKATKHKQSHSFDATCSDLLALCALKSIRTGNS